MREGPSAAVRAEVSLALGPGRPCSVAFRDNGSLSVAPGFRPPWKTGKSEARAPWHCAPTVACESMATPTLVAGGACVSAAPERASRPDLAGSTRRGTGPAALSLCNRKVALWLASFASVPMRLCPCPLPLFQLCSCGRCFPGFFCSSKVFQVPSRMTIVCVHLHMW